MDDRARSVLQRGGLVEITTVGRRSGRPRRVVLAYHNLGGRVYITGHPGRRGWYANLVAHPRFMFHVRRPAALDLEADARPITDSEERRRVLAPIARLWRIDVERMARSSPLVEVTFPGD